MFSVVASRHRACTLFGVMGVSSASNTNPAAWGLPVYTGRVYPDRVVVPQPKPFQAVPGLVPYHLYLHAQNQIAQINAEIRPTIHQVERGCDCVELSDQARSMPRLLPKLGEVLPVSPPPLQVQRIITTQQQIVPATGRLLDQFV